MVDRYPGEERVGGGIAADLEPLILVDDADREVGHLSKAECHRDPGVLHRAFSLLIFNGGGELLLQQRAPAKRLWPLYWSNSCCSHPRRGESMETAIHRRLHQELGLRCPLQYLFKFKYQAQFAAVGAEHEVCSVYIGCSDDPILIDRGEIMAVRWISPEALQAELAGRHAADFTPWFKLEWARVWQDHRAALRALN
jgi:isopentenyl-diphosphate delta-isomerase